MFAEFLMKIYLQKKTLGHTKTRERPSSRGILHGQAY